MSVEFNKFKQQGISPFGSGVKAGSTSKSTGSTAGQTAANNLAKQTTLSSKNWSSMNGSLFSNKKVQFGAVTSTRNSYAGRGGASSTQDEHYVSSGYWNQKNADADMRKQLLTGRIEYQNTRAIGFTGGSWNSGVRAWDRQMQMQQAMLESARPKETIFQKIAGWVALGTAGAGALATGVELFKKIFPGKKGGSESDPALDKLNGANNLQEMSTALDGAKMGLEDINSTIQRITQEKEEAAGKTQGLKDDVETAKTDLQNAQDALSALEQAQEEAQRLVDEAEADKAENEKYLQEAKEELATLRNPQDEQRINELNEEIACRTKEIETLNNDLKTRLMLNLKTATEATTEQISKITTLHESLRKAEDDYNDNLTFIQSADKALDAATKRQKEYTEAITAAETRLAGMQKDEKK